MLWKGGLDAEIDIGQVECAAFYIPQIATGSAMLAMG